MSELSCANIQTLRTSQHHTVIARKGLRVSDRMTKFRPCIDLHAGSVKQIVGGTLTTTSSDLQTNFTSEHPAAYYSDLYRKNSLRGGHVIMLGPGNDAAAKEALEAWPQGLQVGGGIRDENARKWIDAGAEKVGPCHI